MTTIRELQERAYRQSDEKGFHEDYPDRDDFVRTARGEAAFHSAVANYHANKQMLIVGEASEAHKQLRLGKLPDETYRPLVVQGNAKPEGIPSEIADIVIRCADYASIAGFDLEDIILEKLNYNATRAHKHGKNF